VTGEEINTDRKREGTVTGKERKKLWENIGGK
jgi:hypothetical protein